VTVNYSSALALATRNLQDVGTSCQQTFGAHHIIKPLKIYKAVKDFHIAG